MQASSSPNRLGRTDAIVLRFEDFEIDAVRFELRRRGTAIAVPRLVFDLILYLATHRDRPVTKSELLENVWTGRTVTDASLTQAMTAARRAIDDTPEAQRIIRTVHGRGYWWVAETRAVPAATREPGNPFVGRSQELGLAIDVLNNARQGPACLIRVLGEAGIGKTRFAAEVARYASEAGYLVLSGRCAETDGEEGSSPWHRVITDATQALAEAGMTGSASSDQTSKLRPNRLELVEGVSSTLARCVAVGPTLVLLDDLHRADRLSIRLLLLALRDLASAPLVVMTALRVPSHPPADVSLSQLATVGRSHSIELGPLNATEIRELADCSGVPSAGLQVEEVLHRSGGNPFFVTEILRTASACQGAMPASVLDAVRTQIVLLSPECRALLSQAAVCGREFDIGLLNDAANRDVDTAIRSLQEAVAVGIVEEVPQRPSVFRFRHVLVREAIYNDQNMVEKRRHHASIALAIRRRHGDDDGSHLATVAYHLREALPLVERSDVVAACLRAARFATCSLEPEAAISCCEQALSVLGETGADAEVRIELMIALAVAQLRAGLRTEGRAMLRTARDRALVIGAPELAARAVLSVAPGFFSIETGVVDWELIAMLEEALAIIPRDASALRSELLGRLAQAMYWSEDGTRVKALAEEARAVALQVGAPSVVARALLARYGSLWSPATFRERLLAADEVEAAMRHLEDPEVRMMASVFRLTTFVEANHVDQARAEMIRLRGLAQQTECALGRWYPPMYDAMLAIAGGRFRDARAHMAAYHAIGERLDDVNVTQTYLLQSVEMVWHDGRAESVLDGVAANIDRHPAVHEWQAAFAFLQARAGRLRDAQDGLARLAGTALRGLRERMNATIGVAALSETALLLEDSDAARKLAEVIEEWSGEIIVAGYGVLCWGSLARIRGHLSATLGDVDAAEHWYRRARTAEERAGASLWRARTDLAYARLLLTRSSSRARTRARDLIGGVKKFASRNCLGGLDAEANTMMGEPGARKR